MRSPTGRSLYPLHGDRTGLRCCETSGVPGSFPSPTIPVADFCPGHHRPSPGGQSRLRDPGQISRGKLDRRPRTTAGFTFCALDGYGLRDHTPARPTLTPRIRFVSTRPARLLAASFRRPLAGTALAGRYPFTSIGLGRGLAPPSCRTCSAAHPSGTHRQSRWCVIDPSRSSAGSLSA